MIMNWQEELENEIARLNPDRIFVLTDSNVGRQFEWSGSRIEVPSGEGSKSVEGVVKVWRELTRGGATRNSLLVNVGGGVVCDLGGFAAATFKRGIRHINVPTTLLAMADAAIGGKTGIDFDGYKNEVGSFRMPERVIVDTGWLRTLSVDLLADGFAEVVKSAMLGDVTVYERLLNLPGTLDARNVGPLAEWSARFKEDIVRQDPTERGLRRILNLGHTAGHAFETRAAQAGCPVGHGTAVAHGLLISLILSEMMCGFQAGAARTYAERVLKRYYRPLPADVTQPEALIELMGHDKKNPRQGEISFVLLRNFGEPEESHVVDAVRIGQALETYRIMLCQ